MVYECGPEWDLRLVKIENSGSVGITMSGGIDSYVLYNLIGPNCKIFNLKRKDGFDNSETIYRLTGRTDIIEIDEVTVDHNDRVSHLATVALTQYDIDQLYIGLNIIPHIKYFPEFVDNDTPVRPWRNPHTLVRTPFLHLYKYHIIDLAKRLNIDISKTQSCLTLRHGHCGTCWQCRERQWGFEQLL